VLFLAAAVAALVVAALVGIAVVTGDGPARPGAPGAPGASAAAAAAAPLPDAPAQAGAVPASGAGPTVPATLVPTAPLPAPPPPPPLAAELRDPWDTVPVLGRSRTGLGRSLEAMVADLGPEVATCFDPAVHSRYAPRGFTPYRGQDGTGDVDQAGLMLELEAGAEGLRIVGAPVESRGRLDDDTLACAQHLVQGRTLPVAGAATGARFKVRLAISR
jgi:hypothetical protein